MFELARGYASAGMAAYSELQEARVRRRGATATRPPATSARSAPATSTRWPQVISGGEASTLALEESTEADQFHERPTRQLPAAE